MSTFALCGLYINSKRPIKYSIAAATFILTYILLVEKATELQGQKLVCEIVDYYAANKKTPNSLNETNGLLINSFTPSFSKYQYSSTLKVKSLINTYGVGVKLTLLKRLHLYSAIGCGINYIDTKVIEGDYYFNFQKDKRVNFIGNIRLGISLSIYKQNIKADT
jgi:hypothetical protein